MKHGQNLLLASSREAPVLLTSQIEIPHKISCEESVSIAKQRAGSLKRWALFLSLLHSSLSPSFLLSQRWNYLSHLHHRVIGRLICEDCACQLFLWPGTLQPDILGLVLLFHSGFDTNVKSYLTFCTDHLATPSLSLFFNSADIFSSHLSLPDTFCVYLFEILKIYLSTLPWDTGFKRAPT